MAYEPSLDELMFLDEKGLMPPFAGDCYQGTLPEMKEWLQVYCLKQMNN